MLCGSLWQFFVEHYNRKKPQHELQRAHVHLEKKHKSALYGDELLHKAVQKYDDLYLREGASTLKPVRVQRTWKHNNNEVAAAAVVVVVVVVVVLLGVCRTTVAVSGRFLLLVMLLVLVGY